MVSRAQRDECEQGARSIQPFVTAPVIAGGDTTEYFGTAGITSLTEITRDPAIRRLNEKIQVCHDVGKTVRLTMGKDNESST
jgi:hypothetical protein